MLGVAVVLRLLALSLDPTLLSNDILRYLWDGRLVVEGYNPYLLAPEDPALAPLRDDPSQDELWQRMHHHHVPTVYPPLAMALFTAAASAQGFSTVGLADSEGQLWVLRVLLTLCDLGTCILLVYIARRRGLSLDRIRWYAWNPLVSLEVSGMGHVDALGVFAVAATLALLEASRHAKIRQRTRLLGLAGVAAAAGVLAKLAPAPLIPMWSRQSGRPRWFLAAAVLALAAGLLPLVLSVGGVPPGLLIYGVSWEFNGPLFEPLWRLLDVLHAPAAVEATLDGLKQLTGHHDAWNRLYPYNYPQLLAKLLLAGGIGLLLLRSLTPWPWRRKPTWFDDPVAATGWLFGGLLLCSATVYPWYLLWVLPWAALCRQRAWLSLSILLPLSYLPQLPQLQQDGVTLWPWVYLAIWLPFAALLLRFPSWRAAEAGHPQREESS